MTDLDTLRRALQADGRLPSHAERMRRPGRPRREETEE